MLIGPIAKSPPSLLVLNDDVIHRVQSFKLLGVTVNNSLTWEDHVTAICSKASKRLYFLKLLRRSGLSVGDLLLYYQTVIRSVLEYACPVWHSGLSATQADRIESIQRRAMHIITGVMSSSLQTFSDLFPRLSARRDEQASRYFSRMMDPQNCLHNLLPPERDISTFEKLRDFKLYPVPYARTTRFQNSFLIHALRNYQ